MVGGATKSDIWPQIIANVLNRPIETSDNPESACYGAAKIAAGDISDSWSAPGSTREFAPAPETVNDEDRNYRKYMRFIDAVLPLYQENWQPSKSRAV
jgi:sugar (pentulose or hexulose) kinase